MIEYIVTHDDINHQTEIHNIKQIGFCIDSIGFDNQLGILLNRTIINNLF